MIYKKIDSKSYIEEFKDRFTNFADKAPVLLSFLTTPEGVQVIHENSGKSYFFEWDFTVGVRAFIHHIKQQISDYHYPRISRIEKDKLGNEKEVIYRIDKIIALKDNFIIYNEETSQSYCYHMKTSSIFFLKNYREGKFKSLAEAGDYFFKHSQIEHELVVKVG